MSPERLSRRDMLKVGCLGAAAAGVTICGVGAVLSASDKPNVDLPGYTFGGKNMEKRILVAYATFAESTAEVAAEIGRILAERGAQVDVRPVKEITDVTPYSAVVEGSPIHGGWLPEAVEFVRTHRSELARKPFAFFMLGMGLALSETEAILREGKKRLAPVRELVPAVSEGYFAGVLDLDKLPFPYKIMLGMLPKGDHREWVKNRAWAGELYGKLD